MKILNLEFLQYEKRTILDSARYINIYLYTRYRAAVEHRLNVLRDCRLVTRNTE